VIWQHNSAQNEIESIITPKKKERGMRRIFKQAFSMKPRSVFYYDFFVSRNQSIVLKNVIW